VKIRSFLVFASLCIAALPACSQTAEKAAAPTFALKAARLLDGKSDTIVSNAVILVTGDKISAVGPGLAIPKGVPVVDLGDATLLPGLIDSHTHLLSEMDGTNLTLQDVEMLRIVATQSTAHRALLAAKLGREALQSGITTVRDLGNSGVNGDVALRDAIENGWIPGPRVIPSTRALAPQGGQFGRLIPEAQSIIEQEYVTIRGPESARQAVRQALYDGAGCIKVIVNGTPADVTPDEMKAIVDEAHSAGVKVAAHAIGNAATRTAAQAGVDSIEHAYVVSDDVLKLMAEKGIFLVPTDGTLKTFEDMSFGTRVPSEEERKQADRNFSRFVKEEQERLQRAIKFGVRIAAGSDMYLTMPHLNRGEASLLVYEAYTESGMTPVQIVRAATSNAAELLGLKDQIGTLEAGKLADIIAVPGDASKDAKSLQHALFVMKTGEIVKRPN
jgi:imidazolonepropionase-like amidohydrolase